MSREKRNSSYELLRIIAMFFIIIYHFTVHTNILNGIDHGAVRLTILIIKCATVIHVNLFILVTGCFQCKNKFNFSKVWKLINASLFYKILVLAIFIPLGFVTLHNIDIIKEVSLLNFGQYWFVKFYIFLYCLTPYINKLINKMTKKEYLKLLIILFIIMSVIPYFTGLEGFENNGFTLYNMIFVYLIGAYLRLYPMEENYFFKRFSKPLYQIVLLTICFICIFCNITILITSFTCRELNDVFRDIYNHVYIVYSLYSNPIIIIQSIAFFCFFGTFKMRNNFINKLASLTIGIYLIHDNLYVRNKLYKWLGFVKFKHAGYTIILQVFIATILIFVLSALIEWLRQIIFKFIYKRKISVKIRNKYNNWIHNIKFIS